MINTTREYAQVHQHPVYIVIHVLTVPVFMAAFAGIFINLYLGNWMLAGSCMVTPVIMMIIQGVGHQLEANQPREFTGAMNIITRILSEQYFRSWVFLLYKLSGQLKPHPDEGGPS